MIRVRHQLRAVDVYFTPLVPPRSSTGTHDDELADRSDVSHEAGLMVKRGHCSICDTVDNMVRVKS